MEMMSSKNKKLLILLLFIIISNIAIFNRVELKPIENLRLYLTLKSDISDIYQIFYSKEEKNLNGVFSEENSQMQKYIANGEKSTLEFDLPIDTKILRIDVGNVSGTSYIENIYIKGFYKKYELPIDEFNIIHKNQIESIKNTDNGIQVISIGNDPNIVMHLKSYYIEQILSEKNKVDIVLKLIFSILIDILLFIAIKKSKSVIQLATELNYSKYLIWNLSKNDFKTKYSGSYLGIIWAFIHPMITILIYWFVFQYGLKAASPAKEVSFIFWLMSGLIPWFFFQEAFINSTNCMLEYSYLVKKVVFKISILPIIKILSAFFVHLVFVFVLIFIGLIQGNLFNIMYIQLIYYSFCTFFLVLGLSYATSSVILFFRDLNQLISIFLQIGMWMTPIMWSYTIIPKKYQWIAKLNPMYYIVEGYRDTLINKVWFWDRYFQTVYFWSISIFLFVIGSIIFKKLKPHFSDVL